MNRIDIAMLGGVQEYWDEKNTEGLQYRRTIILEYLIRVTQLW